MRLIVKSDSSFIAMIKYPRLYIATAHPGQVLEVEDDIGLALAAQFSPKLSVSPEVKRPAKQPLVVDDYAKKA